MGNSHTPLCRVTWTDVVDGAQHFAFQEDQRLELRMGLEFDPSFWSSFQSSQYFLWFTMSRFGSRVANHQQGEDTMSLPGAGSTELWVGLQFDRARDATGNSTGPIQFRPQIWMPRQSNLPSEFAVAPEDHTFVMEIGGFGELGGGGPPRLVGGPGRPEA